MKHDIKLKGKLAAYIRWPFILTAVLVAVTILVFIFAGYKAGFIMAMGLIIYIVAAAVIYIYMKPGILEELTRFGMDFASEQHSLTEDLDVPYALIDEGGRILWSNNCMQLHLGDSVESGDIAAALPEFPVSRLAEVKDDLDTSIRHGDKYYDVKVKFIDPERDSLNNYVIDFQQSNVRLFAMYIFDATEEVRTRSEIQNQKLAFGIVLIDNFDEAMNSTEEVRRSLLSALVERKITKYLQEYDAIINKIENDRYTFAVRQKFVPMIQGSKFSILDEVRDINIGNELSVTLCIGMGVDADNYAQAQEWARHALDLALGRGGDQAVIKNNEKLSYYGGKTRRVEKSTRVRARVKAHALRQLIEGSGNVVIMGHKFGDVDCVGAAIGVYRASRMLNKKAQIVLNTPTSSVKPVISFFQDNPEYDSNLFISADAAKQVVDENTVLVIVDVSSVDRLDAPELLNQTRMVVVIDHHRQNGKSVEAPVLSYIEPYASSACEMVAEILQYIGDNVKLRPEEADALYAGMVIDTNNFLNGTGVRTFEAAAFLRKSGADITRVRLKLRDDRGKFLARAEAVSKAEIEDGYAFAVCPTEGIESPTEVGAEAANELLNMDGINASFVFTELNGQIFISARSIDKLNVQLVMERLGGGGHGSIAGAQLAGVTAAEAISRVKETLKDMKEKGEI
ncbi:MAG: DHH family phosphoesterase [Lachnospiraceae bacterium]|nr:DHH family phosphoesterase [Lachnospiraceae bacterium]